MSLVPPLVIALGLVAALAVGGYWLMKPTVLRNPGVAAYQVPAAAKVLDSGSETKLAAAEAAATAAADKENRKLGLASTVVAGAKSHDSADRPAAVAVAAKQNAKTARAQKRPEAPNPPRVAQRENIVQSLFGGWRLGMF